ncbi:MAG TPA: hypothetical protein VG496_02725 [Myxococcales bacterium]|nr:hypothetical protein [Myxococcales bacterium]
MPAVQLQDDEQPITKRLISVAERFHGRLRDRVGTLLQTAKDATRQLADVDLVRFEADVEEGSHSLALWEEVAPVTAQTVESVNALIAVAEEVFPAKPHDDEDDNLDVAFSPGNRGTARDARVVESDEDGITRVVAAVCSGLKRDVTRLGERLRNPTVVADPWNLVADLLEFRGRLRAGIGEMIFEIASRVDELTRVDVVPGYAEDLQQALLVRQATTNLAFLFRGHARRIAQVGPDKLVAALQDALRDVHAFSRTRALQGLRTPDKHIFLDARAQLHQLARQKPPEASGIRQAVENLARFLDSLSLISRRETLRVHDRGQLAVAAHALESAREHVAQPARARIALLEALRAAASLYGRDAQLDAYLRAQRHFPLDWIADPELPAEIDRLGAVLGGVSPP